MNDAACNRIIAKIRKGLRPKGLTRVPRVITDAWLSRHNAWLEAYEESYKRHAEDLAKLEAEIWRRYEKSPDFNNMERR